MVNRYNHKLIPVLDQNGERRIICKCQKKNEDMDKNGRIEFPVYECPELTERRGFGTEEGFRNI